MFQIVYALETSLDKFLSIIVIVLLLVGTITGGFFMSMQVLKNRTRASIGVNQQGIRYYF